MPGKTRTIQVVLVRIPKEDVDRYPELLEKRVGFGINSILVETLFDARRFRFLEEKATILRRLLEQQSFTEYGLLYREKVKEGLPKPCHDLLYISGDFRRLYPVGPSAGLLWWQKS